MVLLPRLPSNGDELLLAEAPPIAFCISGLIAKGLPTEPLPAPRVLVSNDDGLWRLCDRGEPDACLCALERGVEEREYLGGVT